MKINMHYFIRTIYYLVLILSVIAGFYFWFNGVEINGHSFAPVLPAIACVLLIGLVLFDTDTEEK